jgi:pimeloyl-ACP methyl ester carboxylesterase
VRVVGWHLLALLAIEAVVYGAIGHHAHAAWGWSTGSSIALACALYLGVRVILVAAEFILARRIGDEIPPSLRITASKAAALYLSELAGWILMFSLVMPFTPARRSIAGTAGMVRPSSPPTRLPILLVHGLACNRRNWFWFRRRLANAGYLAFAMDYTPWFATIEDYAPQVAAAVDEILTATGASQVVIVGHSMGGLVTRAYLARHGAAKVRHVVTLGAPHQGTWMTRFGFTPNVRNMAEDSAWLQALREREIARTADPYGMFTCFFTYHDNLVTPQHNATLPGAARIAVSGIGHLSLALSGRIFREVERVLREATACVPTPETASGRR